MSMTPRQVMAYSRNVPAIYAAEDLRALRVAVAPRLKPNEMRSLADALAAESRGEKSTKVTEVSGDGVRQFIESLR